jgi:hypothetical protein
MPSVSGNQHRFMEMIAHDPGRAKQLGVPTSVGKEFVAADKAKVDQDRTAKSHADAKSRGLTYKQVAHEHGTSKTTSHRKAKSHFMRDGYNNLGSAKD